MRPSAFAISIKVGKPHAKVLQPSDFGYGPKQTANSRGQFGADHARRARVLYRLSNGLSSGQRRALSSIWKNVTIKMKTLKSLVDLTKSLALVGGIAVIVGGGIVTINQISAFAHQAYAESEKLAGEQRNNDTYMRLENEWAKVSGDEFKRCSDQAGDYVEQHLQYHPELVDVIMQQWVDTCMNGFPELQPHDFLRLFHDNWGRGGPNDVCAQQMELRRRFISDRWISDRNWLEARFTEERRTH
jgi:hypothetical protein